MKRFLSAFLAAALLLAVLPLVSLPSARAAASYGLVANTNRLNIRSGPGSEFPIIGGVNGGQWIEIFNSSGSWFQGRSMQDGATGFFSGNFIKPAQDIGGVPGNIAVVNNPNPSSFLNLRAEPNYTSQVLAIFYNGAMATILGETAGWFFVEISGLQGYFRSEFLRLPGGMNPIGTATIYSKNGGSVNLRSGPSYSSAVIGRGAPGTQVTVYLKGSRFWYIGMAGSSGFMDAAFLGGGSSPGGSNPQPNPPIVTPEDTNAIVTQTGRNLNLREQPSTSSRVIGSYPGQTAIRVLFQGSTWSRVTVPLSGKTGYMMTRYLTLYGLPVTPTRIVTHPQKTYVNLRAQPSYSGGVTLRVPHGSRVTVITAGGDWAQVKYNNTTGYMMTAFLK